MTRISPEIIDHLAADEVFVFGSNLEGWHMGGAAWIAHEKFGAVWGCGDGYQGQSYAIPTMHGGPKAIAPLFIDAIHVENIFLPASFWKIIMAA